LETVGNLRSFWYFELRRLDVRETERRNKEKLSNVRKCNTVRMAKSR